MNATQHQIPPEYPQYDNHEDSAWLVDGGEGKKWKAVGRVLGENLKI